MGRPDPITRDHELLVAILDELRTLNERLGGAEPSGPAVADGMTVTEQPAEQPGDTVMADRPPEPCNVITARGTPCGRMPPCRYHGEQTTEHEEA